MKKVLLVLIIVLIVVSCLFPPWQSIQKVGRGNWIVKKHNSEGYCEIWNPPPDADSIDFGRLGIQVSLLLFLGSCIVFSKYIFPPKKSIGVKKNEQY